AMDRDPRHTRKNRIHVVLLRPKPDNIKLSVTPFLSKLYKRLAEDLKLIIRSKLTIKHDAGRTTNVQHFPYIFRRAIRNHSNFSAASRAQQLVSYRRRDNIHQIGHI